MKSFTFLSILLSMALSFHVNGQDNGQQADAVSIGDLDNGEVIVHVYRNKEDPFPFIEFSVMVDESSGTQLVEVSEIQGRTTDGGFMIISGVKRAGEVGVTASERYEISFSKISDYKIYEKAVMDYLRQLPVPEIEPDVTANDDLNIAGFGTETSPEDDIEVIPEEFIETEIEEPELFIEEDATGNAEDIGDVAPVPISGIKVDSNSVIVHVHRNSEDVTPFKEFVLTTEMVNGEEKVKVTEAKDLQPQGQFIIMTGFTDTLGNVSKSSQYDLIPYNVYEYEHYEKAVLDFMLRLTPDQFSGEETTIGLNWEEEVEAEEVIENAPVKVSSMFPPKAKRTKKEKAPGKREVNKKAKQLERAKYKAPKNHNIYTVKKSKRMSARSPGNKKKTVCPSFRY